MKPLLDVLTVRLVLAARHFRRVTVVALFVFGWIGLCRGDTGDWFDLAKGIALGLFFGVIFAFGDELADALEE